MGGSGDVFYPGPPQGFWNVEGEEVNNLLRLIGRRLVALPIMALGVTLLVFGLMSFTDPSIPARNALGEGASQEAIEQYMEDQGLNDPLPERYVNYIGGLLHGDLGTYGAGRTPVVDRIATALPVTMQLTFIGLIIGAVVSFVLGVIAALYRDKWPDQLIRVFSIAGIATPSFWFAVLLILLFSSYMGVLPASGPLPHFTANPGGYMARPFSPASPVARRCSSRASSSLWPWPSSSSTSWSTCCICSSTRALGRCRPWLRFVKSKLPSSRKLLPRA